MPEDTYKKRTAIVFPGIDNKKDFVKIITTTSTYETYQYWKQPIIKWKEAGFTQQVWFNENDFKDHVLKKIPLLRGQVSTS